MAMWLKVMFIKDICNPQLMEVAFHFLFFCTSSIHSGRDQKSLITLERLLAYGSSLYRSSTILTLGMLKRKGHFWMFLEKA